MVACRVRPHVARADGTAFDWGDANAQPLKLFGRSVQAHDSSSGRALAFGPFDALFGPDSSQEAVFDAIGRPIVEAALNGVNGTILAYGQTGSGKTHTMQGGPAAREAAAAAAAADADFPLRAGGVGIVPRVVDGIFGGISVAASTWEFTVRVTYVEIYLERVRDLLNPSAANLTIRQNEEQGVYVEGVTEEYVGSAQELMELVRVCLDQY